MRFRSIKVPRSVLFIAGSIVFSIVAIYTSLERPLSALEGTMFQICTTALGIVGGAEYAKQSSLPHAKSAMRRVISLYKSIARIRTHIRQAPEMYKLDHEAMLALHMIDAIITEQLSTADDAIKDWTDMSPGGEIGEVLPSSPALEVLPEEKLADEN